MFCSNWRGPALSLAIAVLLSGCASAHLRPGVVREDIGRASHRDISLAVPDILNRHGFAILDHWATRHALYYETAWVRREPFADEADRGVRECRTRLIIRARKSAANTFSVTLEAENSAWTFAPNGVWSPLAATEMFQEYVQGISIDLVMEIAAGVRVY